MPSVFPEANDNFIEPSDPEATPLSSAGTGNRNHIEHHRDLGDAIEAMQQHAVVLTHDHSGEGPRATQKLRQVNTHEQADTDTAASAIHHTLGTGPNQAARGNHTHDFNGPSITGQPYMLVTSGTRPQAPAPGLQIYETDTNRVYVWARLPGMSAPGWRLLPVGQVPLLRMVQGQQQNIPGGSTGAVLEWHTVMEDNWSMYVPGNRTALRLPVDGLYEVKTHIAWTPNNLFGDRALTAILLNGQETYFKQYQFVRGNLFNPGFTQTIYASALVRAEAHDTVGVRARHNGLFAQWTRSSVSQREDSRISIRYICP